MAKLLAGQYTLLNKLYKSSKSINPVFIVVHYYKDSKTKKLYNPERTEKNLTFINEQIFNSSGIDFLVFNKDSFEKFMEPIGSTKALDYAIIKLLKKRNNE